MKITRIDTVPVTVPVDRRVGPPPADAKGFRFESHLLLVFIQTDAGLEGVGEVTPSPDWSGETAAGAKALIDTYLTPRLLGEDPRRIRHCMDRLGKTFANPFTKAALEMALFDITGQFHHAPVYQLLGGGLTRGDRFPLRFPIMPVGPELSAEVARRMVSEGFRTIKVKVGHDPIQRDLARLRLVRAAIGDGVRLSVDANGGWSVNEAILAAPHLEELGVAFVEQPVHRLDLEGLAEVRRRTRLPVMADESVFTVQDALRCIALRAADIISVYPGKNGGLLHTLAIASAAEAAGVHCAIGSNLEWDIGSAAMAHACAAHPNIRADLYGADIIGPVFHTERAMEIPLLTEPAVVQVPHAPGLLGQAVTLARLRPTKDAV